MLEHDEFVLAVRNDVLEVACEWRYCAFQTQLWHLHFVGDVVEAQTVRVTSCTTTSVDSTRVSIQLVMQAGFLFVVARVRLITEIPHDAVVRLHVQVAANQFT